MDILIEELENSIWTIALDNGRLEGIEIDSPFEEVRWGSIYWAKVTRIDNSLDAAFVDLDGDNSGILYNRDIRYKNKDGEKVQQTEWHTLIAWGKKAENMSKILKKGAEIAVQGKLAGTKLCNVVTKKPLLSAL